MYTETADALQHLLDSRFGAWKLTSLGFVEPDPWGFQGEKHGLADDHRNRASDSMAVGPGDLVHVGRFHSHSAGAGDHCDPDPRYPGAATYPIGCGWEIDKPSHALKLHELADQNERIFGTQEVFVQGAWFS
jgi:hypothetical protein